MSEEHRLHPDEINSVESRAQTEHKLAIMSRYFSAFASIIAQSKGDFNNEHIWLVDLFAGAGLHLSAEHPDGRVFGTALQACAAARSVQKRYPSSQVHVRLVDLEAEYCTKLRERTAQFLSEGVDVTVQEGDYAQVLTPILSEICSYGRKPRSLWLIDPHGSKILSFSSLLPLVSASGVEIVINLDVTGIARMRGAALSQRESADVTMRRMSQKDEDNLTALYRGKYWEDPNSYVRGPGLRLEDKLARVYLESFRTFRFRNAYPLRSSDSQFRYLIHLTKSATAEKRFRDVYAASQRIGIMKGRQLSETDCAKNAALLFDAYRDMMVPLEDMYSAQVVQLDRGQLGRVLRYADGDGYGSFQDGVMTWREERHDRLRLPDSEKSEDRQGRLF
jgi:three-Cys-motif partner protein